LFTNSGSSASASLNSATSPPTGINKSETVFTASTVPKVAEFNEALADDPELVNKDPYGEGWMVKIKVADTAELADLMDADAYKAMIEA